MKINNKQEFLAETAALFAGTIVLSAIVAIASAIYANKLKIDEEIADHKILISKIETLNKVNSMYEISYKTGYTKCTKSYTEASCSKRYDQITKHFTQEYNTKLLKLLAANSGIELSENAITGKITAIGHTLKHSADQDMKDIVENKGEVISIGNKLAELGLKAQSDASNQLETPDLMKLLELEQANESGSSQSVRKAPALMDTVVDSGEKLFNASVIANIQTRAEHLHHLLFNASVSVNKNIQLYRDYANAFYKSALKIDDYNKENGGKK